MSRPAYNDQEITQYLLGSLSEAENERLDELSLTDEEFAEAVGAAEKDLVDAYVQGALTGAQLEQFKSHYLASPLRRERVDFAEAFQVLAEKEIALHGAEAATAKPSKSATKRKSSGWSSVFSFVSTLRPALQWGTALTALAILIGGAWLVFENLRLRQQVSQTQATRDANEQLQKELESQRSATAQTEQELVRVREERARLERELEQQQRQDPGEKGLPAEGPQASQSSGVGIASFVLAPQMRGVGEIQTVSISPKTNYLALQLELEPGEHPTYRVALIDQTTNQILWRSRALKARAAGGGKALDIRFRADLVSPRIYLLRVTGISSKGASEIVSEYPFKFVK